MIVYVVSRHSHDPGYRPVSIVAFESERRAEEEADRISEETGKHHWVDRVEVKK